MCSSDLVAGAPGRPLLTATPDGTDSFFATNITSPPSPIVPIQLSHIITLPFPIVTMATMTATTAAATTTATTTSLVAPLVAALPVAPPAAPPGSFPHLLPHTSRQEPVAVVAPLAAPPAVPLAAPLLADSIFVIMEKQLRSLWEVNKTLLASHRQMEGQVASLQQQLTQLQSTLQPVCHHNIQLQELQARQATELAALQRSQAEVTLLRKDV